MSRPLPDGEPSGRTMRDVMRLYRSVRAHVRATGWLTALRRLRTPPAGDDAARRYRRWIGTHTPTSADLERLRDEARTLAYQPRVSVLTPVYNTDPVWLRACIESVRRQVYPNWELCLCDDASDFTATLELLREYEDEERIHLTRLPSNMHIVAASNAALAAATGEFVALLDHDDELTPDALLAVVRRLNAHPDADVIYSDEDKLDVDGGRCDPYFKPDWSPDHFLASMYTCHLMVARRALVGEIGGFRPGYEGAQDYDLMLRLMERTSRIHHVPQILYHWRKVPESAATDPNAKPWAHEAARRAIEDHVRRLGRAAEVVHGPARGLFSVRYAVVADPLVSIVVFIGRGSETAPRARAARVARCLRSIVDKTLYRRYEVLVVAHESELAGEAHEWLQSVPHRQVPCDDDERSNLSRQINSAARAAHGEHLLLLDDGVEVLTPEWLGRMLGWSHQDAVGAVGAKLFYPDGRLRHIGIVVSPAEIATRVFDGFPGSSPGYFASSLSVRNYTAVSGACLMTRRDLFDRVGGFCETLPAAFPDVDYCLRIRQAGCRVVFTPDAELYQHEIPLVAAATAEEEAAEMRRRWRIALERDPYYNPNLTTDVPDYQIRG